MTAPMKKWPWPTPEPGIHFNMPFEEYLAIPALQSSGIKNMQVSPLYFWRHSWMSLKTIDKDSQAKIDGRAYHKRILEGADAFYADYAPKYKTPAMDGIIKGTVAMKKWLKDNGVGGYSDKNADQLTAMIAATDPAALVDFNMELDYRARYNGKEFLDEETMGEIELANAIICRDPYLAPTFVGGHPEVTVIYRCPTTGVMMKVRYDYMKVGPICDLKTFNNQRQKPVERAVYNTFAENKYYISGSMYLRTLPLAKKFLAEGRVFNADNVDRKWMKLCAETPHNQMWFLFQCKGECPDAMRKVYSDRSRMYKTGLKMVNAGAQTFVEYYNRYGTDAWITSYKPTIIQEDDLPAYTFY